jgi:hypothetical protein
MFDYPGGTTMAAVRVQHHGTGEAGEASLDLAVDSFPFDGGVGPWLRTTFDDGFTCWCPRSELVLVATGEAL